MTEITEAFKNDLSDLIGTSGFGMSIESVLEEHGLELNADTAYVIDTIVFSCNKCGWYCEASDIHDGPAYDGWVCSECFEDEYEEEENEFS